MRKVILILLVFVSAKVNAQVYQEMPQYGYRANRMAFDSTLQIPTVCGVPTLKSIVKANKNGAIAYDSCNARFYTYNPTTQTWTALTGGGGGSTDTTSLSNRINKKIDSLKRSRDSVYAFINGTRVFQFKDSVGSGSIDTTNQFVKRLTRTPGKDSIIYFVGANRFAIKDSVGSGGSSDTIFTLNPIMFIRRNDSNIVFFNADTANAWRGTGGTPIDTTNQFVKRLDRTPGKDSIIYFVGANRFAIKDSIGVAGSGTQYFVPKWSNTTTLENSQIFDSVNVGINTTTPAYKLDVNGNGRINDIYFINGTYGGNRIFGGSLLEYQSNDSVTQHLFTNEVGSDSLAFGTFGGANAYLVKMKAFKAGQIGQKGTAILRLSGDENVEKFTFLTNGDLIDKNLATGTGQPDKMVTVDSLGKLKSQVIPTGGSADTIYTQNPIMLITRNDSNIIFFNADTANVWRGGGGGVAVDTIFRTLGKDSIFYKKNNITYAIKDSVGTNPPASGYYGAFQDTTTQTAALINTAYGVKLGVTDLSNGVSISNNTRIKIANAGIYNIQFSLQLEKSGSGNMIADIWLRKNGVNLDGTTGKVVLTGSANASPIVAAWNYLVAVSSNDSLELMWSTTNDNVVIKASPATSPFPSIPSAILTVTQQSGIMAGTGISPLDTANMLNNYARTNLVNTKLNISDTSTLQPKSIPSYTFLANNTPATANVTAQAFRDTSGVYNGTITWTGTTAPSGATNHSYRLTQVGKCVTLNISLVYAANGSALTAVTLTLPSGAPTPVQPAGLTAASTNMYPVNPQFANLANSILSSSSRGFLRNNAAGNGFDILINSATIAPAQLGVTLQYWTN